MKQDEARRESERQQALETGPTVTRRLLREEACWGLSEEEAAARQEAEDEERMTLQLKKINMGEKQRKKHYQALKDTAKLEQEEAEKYEQTLAAVYRQKRLQRLSPQLRQKIDLESQLRERIHI